MRLEFQVEEVRTHRPGKMGDRWVIQLPRSWSRECSNPVATLIKPRLQDHDNIRRYVIIVECRG